MSSRYDSSSKDRFHNGVDRLHDSQQQTDGGMEGIEALVSEPDYASITWLASKLAIYGETHPSAAAVAMKGTAIIGQGTTFTVYRAAYKGKIYALKQPRLIFEYNQDHSVTMKQLYSLHLELRVLTDRRIRSHGNIVKLVTILWEEHADDLGHYWPSLVMEYAHHGTLSACYARGLCLELKSEKLLCFGIGDALHFLHEQSVVHGDIKPENVLVYAGEVPGRIIPKLSDFGFSVLDHKQHTRLPGGTSGWEAPECLENEIGGTDLKHADVYSFGLLLWYIARNGKAPFTGINDLPADAARANIQALIRSLKQSRDIANIASGSLEHSKIFYSGIFALTLASTPSARNLKAAVELFDVGVVAAESFTRSAELLPERSRSSQLDLREVRHLGYRIQLQLVSSLVTRTDPSRGHNNKQRSEAAMALAQICLECLGGKKQEEALDWLKMAASLDHPVAKSIIYRVSDALGSYTPEDITVYSSLVESAEAGFEMAMDDLLELDAHKGSVVLQKVRNDMRNQYMPNLPLLEDASTQDEFGESIVHIVARCGDGSDVDAIASAVGSHFTSLLNSRNYQGQTPLLLACIAGEFSTAMTLLELGARADLHDLEHDTPLHWLHMFKGNDVKMLATKLIDHGANVHAQSNRRGINSFAPYLLVAGTPLHRSAACNNADSVSTLLEHGADPLRPNSGPGWHSLSTPLWMACTFHNSAAIKVILQHLCLTKNVSQILNDGDRQEWPFLKPVLDTGYYYTYGGMLGRIARHGKLYSQTTEDTIRILRDHGASLFLPGVMSRPGIEGHPALSSAVLLRCADIVRTMLIIGLDLIEQRDPKFMQPPLHFAALQEREDIMKLLLDHGADINARNEDGITALANHANHQSGLTTPRFLMERGLHYEVPSNGYQTPFFGAVTHGAFELAEFILEKTKIEERNRMINAYCWKGPNMSAEKPGITILRYLLEVCHQNLPLTLRRLFVLVQKFLEHVNILVDPSQRETAFHVLAKKPPRNRIDRVVAASAQEIIRHCSDSDGLDRVSLEGKCAIRYAVENTNYDLIACFLKAGADPNRASDPGLSAMDFLREQVINIGTHAGTQEYSAFQSIVNVFQHYGHSVDGASASSLVVGRGRN